jgi:hypothetical protein
MAGVTLLRSIVFVAAVTAVLSHGNLQAQEVAFLDLRQGAPRTEFRRPAPLAERNEIHGGSNATYGCQDFSKPAGSLRTTLLRLDRSQYHANDSPEFDVKIENIGNQSVQIPISPHVADLQPQDPNQKFGYEETSVVLWIGGTGWDQSTSVGTNLYGRDDHPETMLTLSPGEWVRISAKSAFGFQFDDQDRSKIRGGRPVDHVTARSSIFSTEVVVAPTATASVSRQLCILQRRGGDIPLTIAEAGH